MKINKNDLADIINRDPDGMETPPTEARYAFFKRFVIGNYGFDVYYAYMRGPLSSDSAHNENGTSDDFNG